MKQCYCIVSSVKNYTESKNPKVARTKNGRTMLLSKGSVYQLLSNMKIKRPFK